MIFYKYCQESCFFSTLLMKMVSNSSPRVSFPFCRQIASIRPLAARMFSGSLLDVIEEYQLDTFSLVGNLDDKAVAAAKGVFVGNVDAG